MHVTAHHKILSFFKNVLLLLVLVIVLAILSLVLVPCFENVSEEIVEGSSTWMASVDGSKLLSDLYLPGTHDSATKYVDLAFFARCQALSIKQQLEVGVRYLDIRLGFDSQGDKDTLAFYHGFCQCRNGAFPWSKPLDLDDVLSECYEFLSNNKTETIIFAVKQERGLDNEQFQTMLLSKIVQSVEYWYLSETMPTLDECRGKLVLVRRFDKIPANLKTPMGIPFLWTDQGDFEQTPLAFNIEPQADFRLIVQDRYKYDVKDKWHAFEKTLYMTNSDESNFSTNVHLNFLSTNGSLAYGHPYYYASRLNKKFLESELSEIAPSWIIVDFGTAKLAQHIFQYNY